MRIFLLFILFYTLVLRTCFQVTCPAAVRTFAVFGNQIAKSEIA